MVVSFYFKSVAGFLRPLTTISAAHTFNMHNKPLSFNPSGLKILFHQGTGLSKSAACSPNLFLLLFICVRHSGEFRGFWGENLVMVSKVKVGWFQEKSECLYVAYLIPVSGDSLTHCGTSYHVLSMTSRSTPCSYMNTK